MKLSAVCIATSSLIVSLHAFAQSTDLPVVNVTETGQAPNSSLGLNVPNATGSRLGLTPRETPASVSSISAADMEERNIMRVQDAVKRSPGFTDSASAGNGGTGLTARGFSGHNSVAQLIDGTRFAVGAGTVTFPVSTWPYESIEVLRGPASVMFGDGSIGAAVNYITKQPLLDRREHEAFFTLGSYGTVHTGVGSRGPINDMLAYSAYVSGEKSNGFREDNAYSRQNYALALLIQPMGALKITLSADGSRNDDSTYQGTPLINGQLDDRLRRTSFNVQDSLVKYNDQWLRAKVEYQATDSIKLRNESYYLKSDRHWRNSESYTYVPATQRVTRGDYLEILHDQTQSGNRFDATFDGSIAGMKNRFVAGFDVSRVEFLHTNNSPYGGTSSVNPFNFQPGNFVSPVATTPRRLADLDSTAFFAENALDLNDRWKLVAGLRKDRMTLDSRDLVTNVVGSKSYSPLTGRLGTVWRATQDLSLYGQVATGTDPLSGTLSLPGNLAHGLTKGRQVEAGAKGALPSVRGEWTASVYRIEKRDILSRDATNPLITQQIGKQSSTGVELALAMEPVRGWSIDANLAMLRARYDSFQEQVGAALVSRDGNKVSGVPERTANLWTSYRFAPQWQAGLGLQYVGGRAANAANTVAYPSYSTVDALLRYEVSRNMNLALSVSNLTDKDYAVSGSATATSFTRWLLGAPRTVYLTARVKL
ncbi:MAG: TonB-dependent receptor [Haliea sp.]|nr:MAG: TonB-dependent receptor [Haliea sp.]